MEAYFITADSNICGDTTKNEILEARSTLEKAQQALLDYASDEMLCFPYSHIEADGDISALRWFNAAVIINSAKDSGTKPSYIHLTDGQKLPERQVTFTIQRYEIL